jgi:hypothetical protein
MEEAPENGKEWSHSAHGNRRNEGLLIWKIDITVRDVLTGRYQY